MPGLVVFGRRWSVGSDDLVVPALLLTILHIIWIAILTVIYNKVQFDKAAQCSEELRWVVLGYIIILLVCIILECVVTLVSIRGSILEVSPRASIQYLLYGRLVVFLGEVGWLVFGVRWLVLHFPCQPDLAAKAMLGLNVFQSFMICILFVLLWCTYDSAGRKWVKFKRYQESMRDKTRRARRSGGSRRNWRQRKAMRAYEESWDRRLGLMCCCVERKGRNKNSMSEIAQLFTEFFRDLDVVPSDVVAGLVLLRRYQSLRQQFTINQDENDVHRYLSGIPVTPRTQFLQLGQPEVLQEYNKVIHYMKFAMAAYGWPIFMMMNTGTGLCRIMPYLRCCCCQTCCCGKPTKADYILNDNCCQCNVVALKKISGLPDMDLVYVTYHVDIGETPFFVAVDNKYKKIVICVRGTLSLQDVLTDLKADAEILPLDPVREDWVGHKGMVQAAIYIKKKLKEDMILNKAFQKAKEQSSEKYELVLVGHSLGAGAAAILAILLQQEYQDVQCYAYSPPGGLLSYECMQATKSFITSVVVGKDVVPRIGLPQMELLRTDLINIIKKSSNPKWKIIMKALCCGTQSASGMTYEEMQEASQRDVTAHPSDDQIGLTAHNPMYPPGRIILVVRNHVHGKKRCCGEREPVYQAIWADNSDFQEVLVSPTMVNDHMPDNVLDALEKVLVNVAPPKPTRILTEMERKELLLHDMSPGTPDTPTAPYPLATAVLPGNNSASVVCEGAGGCRVEHGVEHINPQINVLVNSSRNNIDWDSATEMLLYLDKENLFPGYGNDSRLMIDLDSEWVDAPLASPEALSAASSMCALSRTGSGPKGDHRSESASIRLATIKQSPDLHSRSDHSLQESQGSVDDVSDTISQMDVTNVGDDAMSINTCKSVGDLLLKGKMAGRLNVDTLGDIGKGSMSNLLPSESIEFKIPETEMVMENETNGNNNVRNKYLQSHQPLTKAVSSPVSLTKYNIEEHVVEACSQLSVEEEELACNGAKQEKEDGFTSLKQDMNYEITYPEETTQFSYADPNNVYSQASIGYVPGHIFDVYNSFETDQDDNFSCTDKSENIVEDQAVVHSRQAGKTNISPEKKLRHSQSESKMKVLSDQFQMKRSTEEGDIAHLQDSSEIFVDVHVGKKLKQRDSAPLFDKTLLPSVETRLESVVELETGSPEHEQLRNSLHINDSAKLESNESFANGKNNNNNEGERHFIIHDSSDSENEERITFSDKMCLLSRKSSSEEEKTFTDLEKSERRCSQGSDRSLHTKLPEDGDVRLFHSQSCHSTFTSSASGESEQRLSLISGNSEELPIVETDV
ncbi:diacylglycerol lipase-alpha-like isoform X2 [Mya arenaria]|uniref:diacylglycerol lipase-alpha-like isoform X2 n=1 Tax=Mya arenaria TaxID=6604 RepID=UPI0022E8C542|nr:diacylglycerol lipase-alpha-like isoform X2 [Mya arenaria]